MQQVCKYAEYHMVTCDVHKHHHARDGQPQQAQPDAGPRQRSRTRLAAILTFTVVTTILTKENYKHQPECIDAGKKCPDNTAQP